MTVGWWLDRAQHYLEQTQVEFASSAADHRTVSAAIAARTQAYRTLASITTMLIARTPRGLLENPRSNGWQPIPARPIQEQFLLALRAAAGTTQHGPSPPSTGDQSALAQAASALSTAADILAGHLPPGRRPSTLAGNALVRGSGPSGALGHIAALTLPLLNTDMAMTRWIHDFTQQAVGSGRALLYVDALRKLAQSRASSLPGLATTLLRNAQGADLGTFHRLDTIPQVSNQPLSISSTAEAAQLLDAATHWLFANPAGMRVIHLQTAARVAVRVATHALDVANARPMLDWWQRAAAIAAALQGPPAGDQGITVARDLTQLDTWLRQHLRSDTVQPDGAHRAGIAALLARLPTAAQVLHQATGAAPRARTVFIRKATLGPARAGVRQAIDTWHPANRDELWELRRALYQAAATRPAMAVDSTSPGSTRLAFPDLPKPPHDHHQHPRRAPGSVVELGLSQRPSQRNR